MDILQPHVSTKNVLILKFPIGTIHILTSLVQPPPFLFWDFQEWLVSFAKKNRIHISWIKISGKSFFQFRLVSDEFVASSNFRVIR